MNIPIEISSLLSNVQPDNRHKRLYDEVEREYGICVKDILGPSRKGDIVEASHVLIFLIRRVFNEKYICLAKEFDRDHTTIIDAVKSVESRFITNHNNIKARLEKIIKNLNTENL